MKPKELGFALEEALKPWAQSLKAKAALYPSSENVTREGYANRL